MSATPREDLDAAAREIDALIAQGDPLAMEAWLNTQARRARATDARRLLLAVRAAGKDGGT